MRHWITSFRLLTGEANIEAEDAGRKGELRGTMRKRQGAQNVRGGEIEEVMRSSIVGPGGVGAGSASRP
jgi:hypothetical protein